MTIGLLFSLLMVIGHVIRRDLSHRRLSLALEVVENLLALATTTARLDRVYVRILWDKGDASAGRDSRIFLLSSPDFSPSAEWTLSRSEALPEPCRLLSQFENHHLPAGSAINIATAWLNGMSTVLGEGDVPVWEWFFNPAGELRDSDGSSPPLRAMGVGYGSQASPLGCVAVNANGHVQIHEGVENVRNFLTAL
ncbi:MAG: hypothetical protein LBD54_02875 [Puniceicoccales bacterium]|jgi:hypothetical protein|nr:hypothetical protein [Puniceicoccales bacterium]